MYLFMHLNSVNKNRDLSNPFSVHTFRISLFLLSFYELRQKIKYKTRARSPNICLFFVQILATPQISNFEQTTVTQCN